MLRSPADFTQEAAEIVKAFRAAGVPKGGSLLHLGCGAGGLDFHLNHEFLVTGLDISAQMLKHARSTNPQVQYLAGDVRQARLQRLFDAVLLHDAQAYLTSPAELKATYETAAAHLKPGGVLVCASQDLRSGFQQHRVHGGVTRTHGATTVTTMEVDFDPDPGDHAFDKTFVFLIRDQAGQRVETDVHTMGLWDLVELLRPMRAAGFAAQVSTPKIPGKGEGDWVLVTATTVPPTEG